MNAPLRTSAHRAPLPLLVSTALLLSLPAASFAQDAPSGPGDVVLTRLPMSTRSLGLGAALPLADRDPELLFGNPALVERARGMGVAVHRYEREARVVSMATAAAWLGGGVGLGVRSVSYPTPAGAATGASRAGDRLRFRPGAGEATLPVNETAVTAAHGRLLMGFRVGAAVSALELRRDGRSDAAGLLDLGVARDTGPVTIGVAGGGFATALELPGDFGGVAKWATAGVSSRPAPLGPLDVAGSVALTVREGESAEVGGGVEVGYWPIQGRTVTGRLGFGGPRISGASEFSLGAALHGDALSLEYAWRDVSGGRGLHGLSLRFR
jgi:hypothetical protein